eukprot:CAMPEP_0178416526 /NCGR_PEP_ID=MMETSP0689_2-20121128/24109_1 /TAXON_ID=160604 /ORGANISM="Amphidinium massartii, Strain CS-259" /LENGTH=256 /DNA_ID=CAMNT_0020037873 /DNA_START=26 /DNA_END=796 /DNA_ORIENTATION=+
MSVATKNVGNKHAIQKRMVSNILEMLEGSDSPEAMRERMLEPFANDSTKYGSVKNNIMKMFRNGWEKELEHMQSGMTNLGVVAALVLSVTLGLVQQPVVEPVLEDSSVWDDSRDVMADISFASFHFATQCSLICVVLSVMWVNYSLGFIHDADDFIWFVRFMPRQTVDALLVVSLICCSVGLTTLSPVVWADPVASITFYVSAGLFAVVLVYYLTRLFGAKAHIAASMKNLNEVCINSINEAYKQFEANLADEMHS